MKKVGICLIAALSLLTFNSLYAGAADPSDVVISYFQALKNGDTNEITRYIGGKFREKSNVLLKQNRDYPQFLRRFYQDTEVRINNFTQADDNAVVEAAIYFPDGSVNVSRMRLKKYRDDTWRIVEEINSNVSHRQRK